MDKNSLPIGFYDSGAGGISVLNTARRILPNEDYIYFGDLKNAPYGTKTEEEIKNLSLACGAFLYARGVKMIVIACNTATSIVVQKMREKYNIPIVSIEPAVKPAFEHCTEGRILVLATPATLHQKRYNHLVEKVGAAEKIINIECGGLAELIDKGDLFSDEIDTYIGEKFLPYQGENISGIVIGCTHYSFVTPQIERQAAALFNGKKEIFDGMYGTSRRIASLLDEERLKNPKNSCGKVDVFCSGTEKQRQTLLQFLETE